MPSFLLEKCGGERFSQCGKFFKMRAHIKTYGCQMNERDSENIAARFVELGWEICAGEDGADVVVVNTCSVRELAEQKAIGKLGRLLDARRASGASLPVIGVTGCMAQNLGASLQKSLPEIDFIEGARKTHEVADIAARIYARRAAGESAPDFSKTDRERFFAKRAHIDVSDDATSHLRIDKHLSVGPCASISIMQGCEMKCSYCIVPKTRGQQRSRPPEDIFEEARKLVAAGAAEILLLGQVVNAYGRDISKNPNAFAELLVGLGKIDGLRRLRFMSPHPAFFNDALINLYGELPQLCEYVHLPLQSGSDAVLARMLRPYRSAAFLKIAERLRERAPKISISTDIIVGYPGESDEDFAETLETFKKCAFDMAFIFKYSPRIGTKSAELPDDVSEEKKEERNNALLAELAKTSLTYNEALVGNVCEILVESHAKRGDGLYMGRTRTHRKVLFKGSDADIGKFVDIKILSATVTTLCGEKCGEGKK